MDRADHIQLDDLESLREELEKTWQARLAAIAEFRRLEQKGSFLRIQSARARMSRAIAAHSLAVKRYVKFVMQRSMMYGDN